MDKDIEIAKLQIIANYYHGHFTVWFSYYLGGFIALTVLLATLYSEKIITWESITLTVVIMISVITVLLTLVKVKYDANLEKLQQMMDKINKGEPLPSLKELRDWRKRT